MKKTLITLTFIMSVSCYAQDVCTCDYKTSDTSFLNHLLRLEKNEWNLINGGYQKTVKDTLNLDSLVLNYYRGGALYMRTPYQNGKKCGFYEQYYSNGQLSRRIYMKDNKPIDGYYYSYSIDGSIREEGRYRNGYPVGIWISYIFREPFKKYTYSNTGKLKRVRKWNDHKNRWEKTGFHMQIIETNEKRYEIIE